jgi:hypothetical protein
MRYYETTTFSWSEYQKKEHTSVQTIGRVDLTQVIRPASVPLWYQEHSNGCCEYDTASQINSCPSAVFKSPLIDRSASKTPIRITNCRTISDQTPIEAAGSWWSCQEVACHKNSVFSALSWSLFDCMHLECRQCMLRHVRKDCRWRTPAIYLSDVSIKMWTGNAMVLNQSRQVTRIGPKSDPCVTPQ